MIALYGHHDQHPMRPALTKHPKQASHLHLSISSYTVRHRGFIGSSGAVMDRKYMHTLRCWLIGSNLGSPF